MKPFIYNCRRSLRLILFIAFASNAAWAGQESHGGSLVVCEGKAPVVLDYYHATLPVFGGTQPPTLQIEGLSAQQVVAAFRNRLNGFVLQKTLDEALKAIGPVEHWPLKNLPDVLDSNEPYPLPINCKRVQGAMRVDRRVYLDTNFARNLPPSQLGVLEIHEALFYLSQQKTSEKVRTVIRNLMILDTPEETLAASIRDLGTQAFQREIILEPFAEENNGNEITYELFEPKGNEGSRSFNLSFNSENTDLVNGVIKAEYRGNDLGTVTFGCTHDGSICSVIDGAHPGAWTNDCTLKIMNSANKLVFQCANDPRAYVFYHHKERY